MVDTGEKKMEKIYQLLKCLKENSNASQRQIAQASGYSLGMVNSLLKSMEEEGFIVIHQKNRKNKYELTPKGNECIENVIRERMMDKLYVKKESQVKTAVILAAGANSVFNQPIGCLKLDTQTILERIVDTCSEKGIEKFVIVTGYEQDKISNLFEHHNNIKLISSDHYKWSGSMDSLALVQNEIHEDFLLIESDYVFEKRVLSLLLDNHDSTCMFMNLPKGNGDEAYVELDEEGHLFKISKDIHELNRIDGECTGINKISFAMYQKMLQIYSKNKNPYINYEYILENLSRIYRIPILCADDCICMDIDNQKQYEEVLNIYYPKLRKKEKESDEQSLIQLVMNILNYSKEDIISIETAGGMTNANYKVITSRGNYILRMPGKCTETMISRINEKVNGKLGFLLGLNVDTVYFDEHSGIKISRYIENAKTMTHVTVKQEENMKKVASLLSRLHQSGIELKGRFDPFVELEKYESIMQKAHVVPYENYALAHDFYIETQKRFDQIGWDLKPCHCDLVSENLILDQEGRMYLIDWEYSGYNDPMWDLAAHFIECEFTSSEEELFEKYYQGNIHPQKIFLFKILQDILWSAWTMAKEANGEDFGTYGKDRLNRALKMMEVYKNTYEK